MHMKKLLVLACSLVIFLQTNGQSLSKAKNYSSSIISSDLQGHIRILSSDSLAGRGLGSEGLYKAQSYLRDYFEKTNLDPADDGNFLQSFTLIRESPGEVYIRIGDQKYVNGQDFIYYGNQETHQEQQKQLYYVDQLKEITNYDENKIAVAAFPSSRDLQEFDKDSGTFFLISNKEEEANRRTFTFLKNASSKKIYFPSNPPVPDDKSNMFFTSPKIIANAIGISSQKLLDWEQDPPSEKSLKKIKNPDIFYMTGKKYDTITTANVIGMVKGNKYPQEVIVISAHYDHLGKIDSTTYYPGADDDASGVSAVLEIAQAFQLAKKNGDGPKRSILFVAFTGEEEGLFGSSYYVDNPLISLKNTVANLNIDMIGRADNFYDPETPYIYLIGSDKISQELHQLSEEINHQTLQLRLDYRYNADDDPNRFYYRSDHYNFARHGIPVIFYFNGTHEDYHEVTDTENKINYSLLQKRAQLIFFTAWELANRETRLKIDK